MPESLFVNIGSASDNCELPNEKKGSKRGPCAKRQPVLHHSVGIHPQIQHELPYGGFDPDWEIHASGLRNSMGMAFEPVNQTLWQVENSRDAISKYDPKLDDKRLPHDELNLN